MAVSGRTAASFQDSISRGSAEDFDVCCDPCSTAGLTVEANGFCTDCQENLCKPCLNAHKRTKASKHHKLLGQAQAKPKGAPQQDNSPPCTEPCQIHQTEVIKFFCPKHEAVGCNDCMTLDHRTCNIQYIPEICVGIVQSIEFNATLQEVANAISKEERLIKNAKAVKAGNKTSVEEAIREVEIFRKKVNDKLEHLKRAMIQKAHTKRSSLDTNLDQILKTVLQESTELKTIQSTMCENQTKISDARAFTILKQAQTKLKSLKSQTFENNLSNNKLKCYFTPSKVLENALLSSECFGKLIMLTEFGPSVTYSDSKTNLQSWILKNQITVRTRSDIRECDITGCVFISTSRLLLADYWNNKKLKILDIDQLSVVEEKTLEARPYDIALLPQNQVAVSLPDNQEILILRTTSQLKTVCSIPVKRDCRGMVYHQDLLYVVCWEPFSLLVLDMQGGVQRDVTLQTAMNMKFQSPLHIAMNRDGQHLYISDWGSNFVARITLQGKVSDVYSKDEMKGPNGLLVMQDGSLLVCCYDTILHVSSDLKKAQTLITDVSYARCICYQPDKQTIFVGSARYDHIKVFAEK